MPFQTNSYRSINAITLVYITTEIQMYQQIIQ